jgi:hypothetical protein
LLLGSAGIASGTTIPATTHELQIMSLVNQARVRAGLVPLRSDERLWNLANERAAIMAATEVLSHTVAGPLGSSLDGHGVQWIRHGEIIAWTSASPASAATALYDLWTESPPHRVLFMSAAFNYLGIGTARSASGRTYGAIVFTEAEDRTGGRALILEATRSGSDVTWSWTGADTPLQSHTTGLRSFAVQQRTDNGPWVTVSAATRSTTRVARDRARGHWYGLRVRVRDQAGNAGPWSAESRVWVP